MRLEPHAACADKPCNKRDFFCCKYVNDKCCINEGGKRRERDRIQDRKVQCAEAARLIQGYVLMAQNGKYRRVNDSAEHGTDWRTNRQTDGRTRPLSSSSTLGTPSYRDASRNEKKSTSRLVVNFLRSTKGTRWAAMRSQTTNKHGWKTKVQKVTSATTCVMSCAVQWKTNAQFNTNSSRAWEKLTENSI